MRKMLQGKSEGDAMVRLFLEKKEEFSGTMENMPPENSFPQICVVSVNHSVEIKSLTQEYLRSVALSNDICLPIGYYPCVSVTRARLVGQGLSPDCQ
jgi:hypothetical protein